MRFEEVKSVSSKMNIEKTVKILEHLKNEFKESDLIVNQWYETARCNYMIDNTSTLHIDDEKTF